MPDNHTKLLRECKMHWDIGVKCLDPYCEPTMKGIVLMLLHKPTGLWVRQSFKTYWTNWPFATEREVAKDQKYAAIIKRQCRKLRVRALEYLSLTVEYGIRDNLTTMNLDSFEHNYVRRAG